MVLLPNEILHLELVEGERSVNVVTGSGMHTVCNLYSQLQLFSMQRKEDEILPSCT